ncbi:MAG: hypothetical protein Q4B26_14105 [Eubacteriales bacterium]|nr:hypothetical protein [Eubacteriales bacterium]
MRERKPYRKKYSQYYGLSFDGYYAVHHIDFNHDNDDISNLMLLPLATHTVYHTT